MSVRGESAVHVDLVLPGNWTAQRLGPSHFRLMSPGPIADRNSISVKLTDGRSVAFAMLGPGDAKGYPAGDNVPMCPKCRARVEACICQ